VVKKEAGTTVYQESGDSGDNFPQLSDYRAGENQDQVTDTKSG